MKKFRPSNIALLGLLSMLSVSSFAQSELMGLSTVNIFHDPVADHADQLELLRMAFKL